MPSPDRELLGRATDLLLDEADCLDRHRWDDWLALYEDDCLFWLPAWDDDDALTSDPDSQLSLIYMEGKPRLAERVWRIQSGLSSSLLRMPRTTHLVTNVRLTGRERAAPADKYGDCVEVTANFHTNAFKHDEKRVDFFFGRYEYRLRPRGETFGIASKKVIVNNDIIPRQLDIFSV